LLTPIILGILVQKVDVRRVTRPASSIEVIAKGRSHKDISEVISRLVLKLQVHTVLVDIVIISGLDMWVNDHCDASVLGLNFGVHLVDAVSCEVLWVEFEVFVTFWVAHLISPLDIHPKNINWESKLSEITVTLDHHLSTHVCPLAEVETEHEERSHWHISRDDGKILLNFLDTVGLAMFFGGKDHKF